MYYSFSCFIIHNTLVIICEVYVYIDNWPTFLFEIHIIDTFTVHCNMWYLQLSLNG